MTWIVIVIKKGERSYSDEIAGKLVVGWFTYVILARIYGFEHYKDIGVSVWF